MEEQKRVVTYRIDPRPSRLSVRVTAGGLLSAFGHNPVIAARNFTGEAELQADNLESASLHVEIAADSLEVTGDVSGEGSSRNRAHDARRGSGDRVQSAHYVRQ
jgi:hypothetical protein